MPHRNAAWHAFCTVEPHAPQRKRSGKKSPEQRELQAETAVAWFFFGPCRGGAHPFCRVGRCGTSFVRFGLLSNLKSTSASKFVRVPRPRRAADGPPRTPERPPRRL